MPILHKKTCICMCGCKQNSEPSNQDPNSNIANSVPIRRVTEINFN